MAKTIRDRKVPVAKGGGGAAVLERRELPLARRDGPRPGGATGPTSPGRRREDARRRFVSSLAHEVRAPLAAIRNYSEVLLNCPPAAEADRRGFLRAIAEESDRLSRLLEELNLIERLEGGSEPFRPSPSDLGEVASSAALGLHPLASRKRVEISLEGLEEAPLVWGEPNLLARAAAALVENAVKFSLPGGRVVLSLTTDFATRTGTLSVEDEGIGIPPGMEQRIFEKFHQAAPPPDELSPRGSGLGLALVALVAGRHRGEIGCERRERGSRFRLVLPLVV